MRSWHAQDPSASTPDTWNHPSEGNYGPRVASEHLSVLSEHVDVATLRQSTAESAASQCRHECRWFSAIFAMRRSTSTPGAMKCWHISDSLCLIVAVHFLCEHVHMKRRDIVVEWMSM